MTERRSRAVSNRTLRSAVALIAAGVCSLVALRASDGGETDRRFAFVDAAPSAGIDRHIHAGRPGKDHLLDSAGNGVAWLDYDRDGDIDAYIVNAWKLSGRDIVERGRNALYRNQGDGRFTDVTDAAGVSGEGRWGSGVAVADFDDDGWPDLLVTSFGPNVLYRNQGDGTFENVAASAGIEAPAWNTGAALFDADADGDLDLYLARYIDCTLEEVLAARPNLSWKGVTKVAEGPFGLVGGADRFYLSDGKRRFIDATEGAGLLDKGLGYGFSVVTVDLNGDGRLDIYVANDSDPNYYYRNEGGGTFREVGLWSGNAVDRDGAAQAGMGVAFGDADSDGLLDLVTTNFAEDFTTLYRGNGKGFFEDVSDMSGVGRATFMSLSWGTALVDLDNDSDLDLVIVNGHIYPQVDDHPEFGLTYRQRNQLLENRGAGVFVDVSAEAGPGFLIEESSRGLAAGDYDDDGDLDLLISNLDAPPTLLRNDSKTGHWLSVTLDVPAGGGTAIGARVSVRLGERTLSRTATSGGSFMSVHDPRLHFGLGRAARADLVRVEWPDGSVTERHDVPADRFLKISKEVVEPAIEDKMPPESKVDRPGAPS